jgi:Tfp pilus assembly protein PilF
MSLLLQALQKAAKNRESGAAALEEPTAQPPPVSPPPPLEPPAAILPPSFIVEPIERHRPQEPELALAEEDLFEADEPLPEEPGQRFEPFGASPVASPADAAAILRANESAKANWVDWMRDRPVWALGIGAIVFLGFYFTYVYLQIAHPGILRGEFMRQPLAPKVSAQGTARPLPPPPKPVSTQRDPLAVPSKSPAPTTTVQPPAPSTAVTPSPPVTATPAKPVQAVELPPPLPKSVSPKPVPSPATPNVAPLPTKPPAALPPVRPAPLAAAALPRTVQPQSGENVADPEQPVRMTPVVPKRRPRRGSGEPAISVPALEHEISTNRVEPGAATVTPVIKDAYQALQDGRLERAENLYRNALQTEAQNVDALLGLGAIAAQRGQAQQAIGFYERALEVEPRNPTAQAGLISLIGQSDPQMSETRLKQLIAREPSAFLHFNLGNLYAAQNQWPAAQQAYFQAFQMQPDNADYAYNLAIGLEHLDQPKLALTYYRKAIELSFHKGRANFDQNRVIERIGQLSARGD